MTTFRTNSHRTGFTLVEITIALGIVSFALLSIVGTMSVGLTTIQNAKKDTILAQVIAQITSTVLQTPFDEMPNVVENSQREPFYFDQMGRQLDGTNRTLFMYGGFLSIVNSGTSTYPGAPFEVDTSARTVQITISILRPGTTSPISSLTTSVIVPKS